jgi:hypothetical protein
MKQKKPSGPAKEHVDPFYRRIEDLKKKLDLLIKAESERKKEDRKAMLSIGMPCSSEIGAADKN